MCIWDMSHSQAGLWSLREQLHSSCKARSSAQVSFQDATLLHFRCMEAECICDSSLSHPLQEKRKKMSKQFLQSTTFPCMPSMVYFLLHRTDINMKRNSQVLCRNPSCYSDSIPYFWCSFCRWSYFTVQTLLLSVWQLLSLLQIFSYIFPSFIA